jgi:hypothetical protein
MSLEDIMDEVHRLPMDERKQLIEMIKETLSQPVLRKPQHTLLELAGLGAEIWEGIDPQGYVNCLRDEW